MVWFEEYRLSRFPKESIDILRLICRLRAEHRFFVVRVDGHYDFSDVANFAKFLEDIGVMYRDWYTCKYIAEEFWDAYERGKLIELYVVRDSAGNVAELIYKYDPEEYDEYIDTIAGIFSPADRMLPPFCLYIKLEGAPQKLCFIGMVERFKRLVGVDKDVIKHLESLIR